MDELDRLFNRVVRAVRDARPEGLSQPMEVGELLALVPYRVVRSDVGVETNDDFAHAVMRLLSGERGYLFVDDLMQDDLKSELASPNPNLAAYRSYANTRVTLSREHTRRLLESIGSDSSASLDAAVAQPVATAATAPGGTPTSTRPVAPDGSRDARAAIPATPAASTGRAATPIVAPSATAPPAPGADEHPLRGGDPRSTPPRREPATGPRSPRPEPVTGPRAPRLAASPRPLDLDAVAPERAARPGCRYCGQALPEGREVRYCPACGQNLLVRRCAACSAELEPAWKFCVACGRAAAP